ncbi:AraC family ligand binding domain-containing protein [Roseomonas harenae]|uniref:AraC family ligand binding domain-containing protein n=1 Tax=Muricoccus harenae TaxID=2692566 RepID=UPI0013315248|nr:AraC family ligand binding domain-containing protein [Roseomonas harenae]
MPAMPNEPVNLTDAADGMPWSEVDQALQIRVHSAGAILEIHGLGQAGQGHQNDGRADMIYVIVSGYGVLRCGDTALECTMGDVLFVPRGHPHGFEQQDGEIRIWRISLAAQDQDQPAQRADHG